MLPSISKLILCLLGTSTPSIVKSDLNFTEHVQANRVQARYRLYKVTQMLPSMSKLTLCFLGRSTQSIVKGDINVTEYVQALLMLVVNKYTIDCES